VRRTTIAIAAVTAALAVPGIAPAESHAEPGWGSSSFEWGSSSGENNTPPAAPGVSVPGGRYEHPVDLTFTAERATTKRHPLDGTTPPPHSQTAPPRRAPPTT